MPFPGTSKLLRALPCMQTHLTPVQPNGRRLSAGAIELAEAAVIFEKCLGLQGYASRITGLNASMLAHWPVRFVDPSPQAAASGPGQGSIEEPCKKCLAQGPNKYAQFLRVDIPEALGGEITIGVACKGS